MRTPSTYRKNVAAVIVNAEGQILACERSDAKNAWQLPQGGIENEENPQTAILRELEEEIGTSNVAIIDSLEETIKYEWPESLYKRGHRGQEQYYFLASLKDEKDLDLTASKEFQSFKWMQTSEFLQAIQGFKVEAYTLAISLFTNRNPKIFR